MHASIKVYFVAVSFLITALAGPANAVPLIGDVTLDDGAQQGQEECTSPSGSGRPDPWESGDPYCEANEPEWQDHDGPGPYGPGTAEEPSDPAPMSPSSPGGGGGGTYHHWLGVETDGMASTGIYAGMKVVDPEVAHVSDEYFAQRILVQNCDGTRWFETGWTEIGWSSTHQQQYPFVRSSHASWGVFTNEGTRPSPGDRVYFQLRPRGTGDGYWQAFMNSSKSGGWLLLSEFDLGSNTACGNEAYVEVDATSTSRHIPFPTTDWGNTGGGSDGVMLGKPDGTFESWTQSKPSIESNSAAGGRYNVSWLNRYYHWEVAFTPPVNQVPVVNLFVTPTSGNRSTSFGANLSGSHDPDGGSLSSLRIDWGDGTSSFPGATNVTESHRYPAPGTYSLTGRACDDEGACVTSASRTVTVADSNSAPTMMLFVSPSQGDVNTTFTASIGGMSDPEGDPIVATEIDWGDGTTTPGTSGSHRYAAPGTFNVTARATDSRGAVGSDAETIRVCEVYAGGTCASSSAVEDVTDTVSETVPQPPDPSYDTVCEHQYIDHSSGACTHPDRAEFLGLDSTEQISADYRAENAGVPGYCRQPDNGNRYRVVYAHTRNQNSRYGALKDELRNKAERADYYLWKSARLSGGPGRHFRFVCNDKDEIRIFDWKLPNNADNDYQATFREIREKKDYDATKRHLVFTDWADSFNSPDGVVCGWGGYYGADRPGPGNPNNVNSTQIALVNLRPGNPCGLSIANSATHELTHTLGAVMNSAPHEYDGPEDWDGHPTDQWDVLGVGTSTVSPCNDPIFKNRLDCGFNDYFNADPKTPARHTYLADQRESSTGDCQTIQDGEVEKATKCNWNTAWSKWLIGGNP